MNKELERKISDYLAKHSFCSLATIEGERPNSSTVEFVNEGVKLYVVSFANTQKTKNISKNPSVSITVHSEKYHDRKYVGVQYFGKAELCTNEEESERVKALFFDKYMTKEVIHWNREKVIFYEIKPERIDFIDYSAGFGHKDTWTAE